MMRLTAFVLLALVALIADALMASARADDSEAGDGKKISVSGGEHARYSRVVLDVAGAPYIASRGRRSLSLKFPQSAFDFELSDLIARRQAHRVLNARVGKVGDAALLELDLTCDCGAKISYGRAGKLVVDISEDYGDPALAVAAAPRSLAKAAPVAATAPEQAKAKTPPVPLTPDAKKAAAAREANAIASDESLERARRKMLALLNQAADEGLISYAAPASAENAGDEADGGNGGESSRANGVGDPAVPACRANDAFLRFDLAALGDPFAHIDDLRGRLVGEFDKPDEAAVRELFWTYLAVGFGDEARNLVEGFPLGAEDQRFFVDLARTVSDRPVAADSPLITARDRGGACEGVHALWRAAALAAEAPEAAAPAAAPFERLLESFPPALAREFGVRLGLAAARIDDFETAGAFKRVAETHGADSAGYRFLVAEIDRWRGREDMAQAEYVALAASETGHRDDALFALAEQHAREGAPSGENAEPYAEPYDGFAEDMGMIAAIAEDDEVAQKAAVLEARALISRGEFDAAFAQLIRTYEAAPGARYGLGLAARSLLVEAMTNGDEGATAAALNGYFRHRAFVEAGEDREVADDLHLLAARTALRFGLPEAAAAALKGASASARAATPNLREAVRRAVDEVAIADTGRQKGWAPAISALKAEAAEGSVESARALAVSAYLAGEPDLPAEAAALLQEDGDQYTTLFSTPRPDGRVDALAAKELAAAAAMDVRVLKEAIDGQ